jgi:hypothetical protein
MNSEHTMRRHPRKLVQAKHVPDAVMLRAVYDECVERDMWAMAWFVDERLPAIPPKVCQAKRARLIDRRLMTGCVCGCRGDFELTAAGYELLGVDPWRDNPEESIR